MAVPAGRNGTQKEAEKKLKYKESKHSDMTNDHTCNDCSPRNGNKRLKESFASHARKTFNRFTTKDSYNGYVTRNTGSTTVWNLKSKRWGSPLDQEKYQEQKACDKQR